MMKGPNLVRNLGREGKAGIPEEMMIAFRSKD